MDELSLVLVTLDTTRADRIGAFGGTTVPTPNLDEIAYEGTRFLQAISQVPLTLPAHASILTGRYPASHGVRHNGIFRLPDDEPTVTQRLKEAGFNTAAFVGAYVLNRGFGLEKGFDVYDDIPKDRYTGGRDILYEAQRTADEVNAAVFRWLDARPQGRLFLWVHYYDPHVPYAPPETPGRTLHGKGYDREISYMDHAFGDLMRRLRREGLLDRSLVVVVGDHGESLGEHRELTHGVFLYEGAVRVPLMFRAPGHVPRKRAVQGPAELVDLAPTILDYLELPPMDGVEGGTLRPRIEGRERAETAVAYAETLYPRLEFGWSELRMVRDSRFKFIQAPKPELYDLEQDPKETKNLLGAEPALRAEMQSLLQAWIDRTEKNGRSDRARQTLSPDEEARLRSLGYLGGDFFRSGLNPDGSLPDPKDRIDEALSLNEARDFHVAGRHEEALERLTTILRESPRNHQARTTRIEALVRLGRLAEAEEEALAALAAAESEPGEATHLVEKARRALASVYWMMGRHREAEEQYRHALEVHRANPTAPIFEGILLDNPEGITEARRLVDDVLRRVPTDSNALAARFELDLAAGDRDAAIRSAEVLARHGAGDPPTLVKAGRLLRESGQAELAVACFEAASRKAGPDPDILGFLGTARIAAGDLRGAEAALRTAGRLRPEDPRPPFYLGNVALLRGDEAGARRQFDRALLLDAAFVEPIVMLARYQASQGRLQEALATIEEALRRKPQDSEVRDLRQRLERALESDGRNRP
jgi:arylsulfatase A-like enzyme/cytochrome c-type biogenesis protein CcmH/NrfG